jgi:enoyl-CoA hydratase
MRADYSTLDLHLDRGVAALRLARPGSANALTAQMWQELREALRRIDEEPEVRVVVLSGRGDHFCAGIDLATLSEFGNGDSGDTDDTACPGRAAEQRRRVFQDIQDAFSWVERCRKPVIAAVHGMCVGAGLDLAVACDLRYASAEATFVLKQLDMGVTGDVGVLQRLPRIVGEGVTRELAYTCRPVTAAEAEQLRLVNKSFGTPEQLERQVFALAHDMAGKSPLALRGTKRAITYARDHSIADGLEQVATWNAATLVSDDLNEALAAFREKRPARFHD